MVDYAGACHGPRLARTRWANPPYELLLETVLAMPMQEMRMWSL